MSIATVLRCQTCGAFLPPMSAQCDGSGLDPLGAYTPVEIEWTSDDGDKIRSRIPMQCAKRWRAADGRVRVPRSPIEKAERKETTE